MRDNKNINAMVFAAGLGTRLKPLTDTMPKALVPVAGSPLLKHVLDKLTANGVGNIVVNVHHFANRIIDCLKCTDIKISDESDMLLDTGGGLKKARSLFMPDAPVLVHNVDILSNLDLQSLFDHSSHAATLVVSERKTKRYLLFDDGMRLVGWTNIETGEVKSPYENLNPESCHKLAFAGIHLISQELLKAMDEWPEKFSIIDFYLAMCSRYDIRGYVQNGLRLMDVGKIDTLHEAEDFLTSLS